MIAREVTGEEKAPWWERAVEAFPDYAAYQQETDREIPVFLPRARALLMLGVGVDRQKTRLNRKRRGGKVGPRVTSADVR